MVGILNEAVSQGIIQDQSPLVSEVLEVLQLAKEGVELFSQFRLSTVTNERIVVLHMIVDLSQILIQKLFHPIRTCSTKPSTVV